MTPAERRTVIRAVTPLFVRMTEPEADSVLRGVGANSTPALWGEQSEHAKAAVIRQRLALEPDSVLDALLDTFDVDLASSTTEPNPSTTEPNPNPRSKVEEERTPSGPIFVVHGHARAALHEAVRVLERGTRREVIVLHEQANAGRTILEKFEDYAGDAAFAVVLLTADDEGGVRASSNTNLRGRQNVIFELGFFFGKLGRQRVAVLLEENIEKPSDVSGLVYITLDQAGAWKQALARELEAAGISVDRARIP